MSLYCYSHKANLYHEAKQKGKELQREREERVLPYLLFATISNVAVALSHAEKASLASYLTGNYGYFKSIWFLIVTYAVLFCKYMTTVLTTTLLHHYNSLMSLPELLATSWHNLGVTGDVLPVNHLHSSGKRRAHAGAALLAGLVTPWGTQHWGKSVPEGLLPVESTHAGVVWEEL